jgi:hypothetical protein
MFFNVRDSYIAIIGDIVESKKIVGRNEVQYTLKSILNLINEKYMDDIASKFMITLGDEFQGLLKCGKNVMNIISDIEIAMLPVRLRFGVGIGMIDTEINPDIPLGADGPAYHNARKMIDELKKKEKQYKESHSNIMIAADWDEHIAILLNSILSLCSTVKSKWSKRQTEIINCYLNSDNNQYKTAEKLSITQSSVNKALDNSSYYSYRKALDTVNLALSEIEARKYV